MLFLCVVVTTLRIDVVIAVLNIGRADDVGDGSLCVVMEGVGNKHRLRLGRRGRVDQSDIVVEDSFVCGRIVFAPVTG